MSVIINVITNIQPKKRINPILTSLLKLNILNELAKKQADIYEKIKNGENRNKKSLNASLKNLLKKFLNFCFMRTYFKGMFIILPVLPATVVGKTPFHLSMACCFRISSVIPLLWISFS